MVGSRLLIGSLLLLSVCYAQLTLPGKINPHGNDNCSSCHTSTEKPAKENYNPDACVVCHTRQAVNSKIHQLDNIDIHGSGISIPADFPMEQADDFSCLTCHEVTCKTDRANQTFLRGGPFQTELDFCFVCHESKNYTPLNPHKQRRESGALDESTCLHCHIEVPNQVADVVTKTAMHLEMTPTCNKCHALHHHEAQHIDKGLASNSKTLQATEARVGIRLPVSAENTIQCNTCHYTHPRGVLNGENVVYDGPGDNEWQLRLDKEQLCLACHDL